VFDTVIPRNVRLGEAPSHGKPVILYDVKSRGAEAYLALAREMIARSSGAAAAVVAN
jgi:chromosome partitioning protein